jgi:hypothetical protein
MSVLTPGAPATTAPSIQPSLVQLNLMRVGYLLMGVGLAVVKWPLLAQAREMPLYEGVTLCLLVAMSLLALLGLRYPVRLLPVLLFETTWKLLWLGLVALPHGMIGDVDAAEAQVIVNCSLIVVVIAVTPWRFVWARYVRARGDRWTR